MMWLKIVRGSVSQITWDCKRGTLGVLKSPAAPSKKKEVAYFGTWKSGRALRFLTLPILFWFPLPFGLNFATLQLCAWCMLLPYTNSWGAPIVGPGLFLTFTIFSHHSFKYTDPTTRVRGCVIMDLWVHARVESYIVISSRNWSYLVIYSPIYSHLQS